MTDKPDPGSAKGPGGMTMRELHELVKKSHLRDQAGRAQNKLAQPQNRSAIKFAVASKMRVSLPLQPGAEVVD